MIQGSKCDVKRICNIFSQKDEGKVQIIRICSSLHHPFSKFFFNWFLNLRLLKIRTNIPLQCFLKVDPKAKENLSSMQWSSSSFRWPALQDPHLQQQGLHQWPQLLQVSYLLQVVEAEEGRTSLGHSYEQRMAYPASYLGLGQRYQVLPFGLWGLPLTVLWSGR